MSCSVSCPTAASVAMNPSIVAMLGWIMPAPFAMPVTVIVTPSITTCRDTALGTVSVVMIAAAASAQPSARKVGHAAGMPAATRSTGSGSMITPVENGRTEPGGDAERLLGRGADRAGAFASPGSPVPAFAIPVFTTMARIGRSSARCSRQTVTGAAQ